MVITVQCNCCISLNLSMVFLCAQYSCPLGTVFMSTGHCIHVHWALYSCPLGTVFMSTGHCIHVHWHYIPVHWHCVFMTTGTVFMSTSTVFLEPMNIRTSRSLFWRSVCQVSAGGHLARDMIFGESGLYNH